MKVRVVMLLALVAMTLSTMGREKLNFNADWRLYVGDVTEASNPEFDDSQWQRVTLPYAFNGDEAFRKDIVDLTDTICWYRKEFKVLCGAKRQSRAQSSLRSKAAEPSAKFLNTSSSSRVFARVPTSI